MSQKNDHSVLITQENSPQEKQVLEELAGRNSWTITTQKQGSYLFFQDDVLQFYSDQLPDFTPLSVDFVGGKLGHRRRFGKLGKNQLLAKAIGLKEGKPHVLDATMGLASDAFSLLCLGCSVVGVERSALMVALVEDAVRRAKENENLREMFTERFQVVHSSAENHLQQLSEDQHPEVIFLDPMFPAVRKSALSGREMQYLQVLFESSQMDTSEVDRQLLDLALKKARRRVVVKRPTKAPPLMTPFRHQFLGNSVRYDVY